MESQKLNSIITKIFKILIDGKCTYGECKEILQQTNLHLEDKIRNFILVENACPKE